MGTYPIKLRLADPLGAEKIYSFDLIVMETIVVNDTKVNNREELSALSNVQLLAALDNQSVGCSHCKCPRKRQRCHTVLFLIHAGAEGVAILFI